MNLQHTTIAFPRHRSDLLDAVAGQYSMTHCARYDGGRFMDPLLGLVWCFVDPAIGAMDLHETCRQLRNHPNGRLFFITAVVVASDQNARSAALKAGADECIPGPLTPQTLHKRIEQRGLKRTEPGGGDILEVGDYTIDFASQRLFWNDRRLDLRPSEFRLFTALLRSRNRLLSLEDIIAISGTAPGTIKQRTVHVWMGRLRRILSEHAIGGHIRSVRTMGYVFDYSDDEPAARERQSLQVQNFERLANDGQVLA